jgi:hypothetical protein
MNKILLALIAAGLWANVIVQLQHPAVANTTDDHLSNIENSIYRLVTGTCTNSKLC